MGGDFSFRSSYREESQKWTTCRSALCMAKSWFGNRPTFRDCSLFPISHLGAGSSLKKSTVVMLNHFWGVLCSPPASWRQLTATCRAQMPEFSFFFLSFPAQRLPSWTLWWNPCPGCWALGSQTHQETAPSLPWSPSSTWRKCTSLTWDSPCSTSRKSRGQPVLAAAAGWEQAWLQGDLLVRFLFQWQSI